MTDDNLMAKGKQLAESGKYTAKPIAHNGNDPRGSVAHEPDWPPDGAPDASDPPDPSYDNGHQGHKGTEPLPKLWPATDLKPAEQPRWLARNRIPRAAVSLIIGEEGIGKSLLWVWLAAIVTTGRDAPEFGIPARAPSRVIVAAITEDDWTSVVRPRLEAAGADLRLIQVVCAEQDGSGAPQYPRDLQLIRDAAPAPVLIIVDAWLDTVAPDVNVRDTQQARRALHPWKELATRTDAAVLLLCHTNRIATANARDRYGSTIALRQKARMSIYCQTDDDGHLIAGPEKANGSRTVPASKFGIEAFQMFAPTEDDDGTVPRLLYADQSDQTARQHLAETFAAEHASPKNNVVAWLAAYLGAGPRWVTDLIADGDTAGYKEYQIKRAKPDLSVKSKKDGASGAWFWYLPQHQGNTPSLSLAPLLPCSLAPETNNQENTSTSKESKRVNTKTYGQGCSLAPDHLPGLDPTRCSCGAELTQDESVKTGLCAECRIAN